MLIFSISHRVTSTILKKSGLQQPVTLTTATSRMVALCTISDACEHATPAATLPFQIGYN